MGQRANLVIVKDGAWHLYYDHWCANRLDVELFWGPEHSLAFIEQRESINKTDWLDEIWCEGGAVKLRVWFAEHRTWTPALWPGRRLKY